MSPLRVLEFIRFWQNKYLPREKIELMQLRKLQRIVKYAYENVDYYRKLLDSHGLKPGDIKKLDDIKKIPVTSKKDIQPIPLGSKISRQLRIEKLHHGRTSGSTGIPFDVYYPNRSRLIRKYLDLRGLLAIGYSPLDVIMKLEDPKDFIKKEILLQKAGFFRKRWSSLYANPEEVMQDFLRCSPDIIFGPVSSVYMLSKEYIKAPKKGKKLKFIATEAEMLDGLTRKNIESAFRTTVFHTYGSTEFGTIGWECKNRNGYHVAEDIFYLEIARIQGTPENIVITDLDNYAMPFIRYSMGDKGVISDERCNCGSNFKLIKKIFGRSSDYVKLSSGKTVSPYLFTCSIEKFKAIQRYQVIQKGKGEIEVLIIPERGFDKATALQINDEIASLIGNEVHLEIKIASKIKTEKGGKFHMFESRLKNTTFK